MRVTAHIALGSNLGDRGANIAAAIAAIAANPHITVVRVATPIETAAVGGPPGSPPFLNSAAELRTDLEPLDLLRVLHEVELTLGRVRSEPNAPRTVDLDLLLYGDRVISSAELILPHPRMHERAFVLRPLAEIAAHARHPLLQKTVAELLKKLAS